MFEINRTMTTALLLALGLAACGGQEADLNTAEDGDALDIEVAQETSGLTSDACGNVQANAILNVGAAIAGSSTSVDGTYGSTQCPGRYVVELSNTTGQTFTARAEYGGTLPKTEAACTASSVTAKILVPNYIEGLPVFWTASADQVRRGVWGTRLTLSGPVGFCSIAPITFGPITSSPYNRVRIAARAAGGVTFGNVTTSLPTKVRGGFTRQ